MSVPWQREEIIGDARLLLGDARSILPSIAARSIDFIFTDPPFGHNNNNGDLIHRWEEALGRPRGDGSGPRPIANDGAAETASLVRWAFGEFNRLLARGGCCCCCCCCGGGGPDPQFARWSLWLDEAVGFKHMIVWDKGPMGMGWHYRRSYETVLVGEKKGGKCRWFGGDDIENIIRPGKYGIRKIIPQADEHPTPKPVELPAHFIRLHSQPGDLVLDPFMGGGSTAEAAMKLGRRFVGVELDPVWFEYTRKRLEAIEREPDMFRQPKPEQLVLIA